MKPSFKLPWVTYLLAAWVLLTVLFAALAPSASEGLSFAGRVVFWAVHVGLPIVLLQLAQVAVSRFASRLSDWVSVSTSGFLGALAFVPAARGLDALFPEDDDGPETWVAAWASETTSTIVPVMLVWVALNAPRLLRIAETAGGAPSQERDNRTPVFWAKVPRDIGRDLVSLSAELHYLRVHTRDGNALILYSFGNAVEELADLPGLQVHRSHWVALAHIKSIVRRGDGATVHMSDGPPLPVSRKYRKVLNNAHKEAAVIRAG
ncbi:MAG: LytTR family transcriptional regulator [Silicimonas sp.]|nr:LytTR family transcriptional regulator [Silicimonas sp.]